MADDFDSLFDAGYSNPGASPGSSFDSLFEEGYKANASSTPSLFSEPVKALTSADWWLTRPSGERITAAQGVAGPAVRLLDAVTLGAGDEITAGGSAMIDDMTSVFTGGEPGDYERELDLVRGVETSFKEASPIADLILQVGGATKFPIGTGLTAEMTKTQAAKQLAKEGAGYGAAYGFNEGEGGAINRLQGGGVAAGLGAVLGPAIGVPLKAGGEYLGAKLPELKKQLYRKILGPYQSEFYRSAKEEGFQETGEKLVTKLTTQMDELAEDGIFASGTDATALMRTHDKNSGEYRKQLSSLLGEVDEAADAAGQSVGYPSKWRNAERYIKGADKENQPELRNALGRYTKLLKEDPASARYFQNQKVQKWKKAYPAGKGHRKGLDRAIGEDLKEHIESISDKYLRSIAPEKAGMVKQINKKLAPYEATRNMFYRNLAKADNADPSTSLAKFIRNPIGGGLLAGTASGSAAGLAGLGPIGPMLGAVLGTTGAAVQTPTGRRVMASALGALGNQAQKASIGGIEPLLRGVLGSRIGPVEGVDSDVIAEFGPDDTQVFQEQGGTMENEADELAASEVSPNAIDLIKKSEALRLKPYNDMTGKPTIGYGHTGSGVKKTSITEQEAEELLAQDIQDTQDAIARLVDVELTQGQRDALTSFIFNFGEPKFRESTLLKKINKGDMEGAAKEFDRWVYAFNKKTGKKERAGGLVKRRREEKKLFLA